MFSTMLTGAKIVHYIKESFSAFHDNIIHFSLISSSI